MIALAVLCVSATNCGSTDSTSPKNAQPALVETASQTPTSGTVGTPPNATAKVRVVSASGAPVGGVAVHFAVANGLGTVVGADVSTAGDGTASPGRWTLDTIAGANTLTAAVTGLPAATFSATGTPDAIAKLSIDTAPSLVATNRTPLPIQPSLQIRDRYNNAIHQSGIVVFAQASASCRASVLSGRATTDALGRATFTQLTLVGKTDVCSINFISPTRFATSASTTIRILAGSLLRLLPRSVVSQIATVGMAVGSVPSVVAYDADSNAVAGTTISFAIRAGSGTVTGATQLTDSLGIATVGSWLVGTIPAANSLEASTGVGAVAPISFSATSAAGPITKLAMLQPPSPAAMNGAVFVIQPRLQLQDAFGNAVPRAGISVMASVGSGGGSLGGQATVLSDSIGQASYTNLAVTGLVGQRTLIFSAGGLTPSSATLALAAGAPARLLVVAGDSQVVDAGTALPSAVSVLVVDVSGNPVGGAVVHFTASLGGSIAANSASTLADGTVRVPRWVVSSTPGVNTLLASVSGVSVPAVARALGVGFLANASSIDSTPIAGGGGRVTLASGSAATVLSSKAAPTAKLLLSEIAGTNPGSGNDTSRRFVARVVGGGPETTVVRLSVAIQDTLPTGSRQYLFVQRVGDSAGIGTWIPVDSAGAPLSVASIPDRKSVV